MKKLLYYVILGTFTVISCKNDDPPLPDNLVNFVSDTQGMESEDGSATVTLNLSRSTDVAVPLTIDLQASGVNYGTQFTTEPSATEGSLMVTVPAGSNTVSFKVVRADGVLLEGTESLAFTIKSAGQPVLIGQTAKLTLSFASIISQGSSLTLNGGEGGAAAVNSVFVDLSANSQVSVARDSWDLGFYSGDDFRVILNNSTAASVVTVNKTDLAQVSSADINIADLELGFGKGTFSLFDDVTGDLAKTAIQQVSATDGDNKVYVINRAGGSGTTSTAADLVKVRIVRASGGYTLQFAKLNETTFKTVTVTKDTKYNFNYVSFNSGAAVAVEPTKDHWDMEWTYSIYFTGSFPYAFSDLIFTNYLGNTQSAEVLTSTVGYQAFNESNLSSVTFSNSRNTISSNWRTTSPSTQAGVKTDRFYVIKDAAGNIYKIKFISFTTQDGGTRGYPKLEYALVKKGV
ncbi:HmuY protein [bacterium A37T11]|nr:HmuY protein [bacterium A37T11]